MSGDVSSSLLDSYDAFLFDLDGVLYRGDRPIPGAADAVAAVRSAGRRIAFMTNSSARTSAEVAEHLTDLGVPAAAAEISTSAVPTARLLRDRGCGTAFVIGGTGVRSALTEAGIAVVGEDAAADAVVVGWDRSVDYAALRAASVLVERGAAFVGTNGDVSFPAPDGTRWPGTGALLAAIAATTGATPEIAGKPNAPVYVDALERAGGGTPLVVGDRLDTDVAGAAALRWDSLLVLTGISRREDLDDSPVRPTYVAEDLSILSGAGGPANATTGAGGAAVS